MPGRAYVGGLFGAGGPLADNDFVAGVFCCWAQESVAVAKAAAIIAVASREIIRFFTSISLDYLLEGEPSANPHLHRRGCGCHQTVCHQTVSFRRQRRTTGSRPRALEAGIIQKPRTGMPWPCFPLCGCDCSQIRGSWGVLIAVRSESKRPPGGVQMPGLKTAGGRLALGRLQV